ncbi:bifunctional [glutamate--ammonia ligase]-adenylyl-L-tyrosine phosphorylase/[glutamate--ammonia-ligase] adenylyltransferase [Alteromonas australica]|uniref:Bifunctional glutamine synthetase adenylyltransferase/adenylyl-removing enzyme n=3 Tax=Alteromonas australica TaxID=589873 RepID=A0A358DXL4_9ALTE|nr:bifunctional [glutamate--ammonia ligase]-adenylyl-L-tyrosine phosphorylase/[glutamate--ammonia-ligase] adenylyltransferase [Alteromonas australica]MAF70295.1 bifunctional [glutamate--ammonia ligase]-adenylyl-L-tyrosine phosphorylase/[glutamate--ammonia-ligase] adenylyltransferase [Alteromonas sp.]HBU51029.1 bifunctional [glutamate--ammonia ligase]-adenylyl-L-tyrosine phosphorylase/[glutamate--ammonia-ligase] adenylyltransferase [Alteromonas australica]
MPIDNTNSMNQTQLVEKYWETLITHTPNKNRILANEADIKRVFSRSPFVADVCAKHPEWLVELLDFAAPSMPQSYYHQKVSEYVSQAKTEDGLAKALRRCRQFHMAAITFSDVLNRQSIDASLLQVSLLANALIQQGYTWLYSSLCSKHGTPVGSHGPMPMYILGMGKLGGHELNFSSDIDLIFTYPEKGETQGGKKSLEHQQFFTRLAQKLIQALNKVTVDGQVYRVDMRLRPFGESGPLVLHFDAMEDYYQEQGRHWERFAMVKARVINSDDSSYEAALQAILTPFTFRRYLDFTTLDALRNMKKLIATEIRRRKLNNNIKLGAGGIREVEFFAQSFQLIHGGREPSLQSKSLLTTLKALEENEIVENEVVEALKQDYLFLRKVEHTLQQYRDQQTQTLPEDEDQRQALIEVMGFPNYAQFLTHLDAVMARIHGHFNELIEESQDAHDPQDSLFSACCDAWQLQMVEHEFCQTFASYLPPEDASRVQHLLLDFNQNQRRYLLGQRGEDTLNKLIPEILYVLITHNAQGVPYILKRVLGVISAITGRTTYLDLLLENPDVLKQLVRLCERSEWVANEIKRFPLLLDELLTPLYLEQQDTDIVASKNDYISELRQSLLRVEPDDVEAMMDTWRQFKLCQQLRIAASDISGSLPIANVSDKLTVLAEVVLEQVVHAAWHQISERFGIPNHLTADNSGFAVVAYGKLGGYELGYGSDLDLVFLHNAPREATTTGAKSIEAQQFYIKLAQRIMHLLNTKTLFGQLYETDLRLRPSGNAGLLCCHLDGFKRYQQEEAWTWEHQALVRARGVCGDKTLLTQFADVRAEILGQPRDKAALRDEVCKMRTKMRQHLLNEKAQKVDLKQCVGGITDIEFMTQYWVLANASTIPSITRYTDNLRILNEAAQHGVIDDKQAKMLQDAYLALREQYHHLTLADTKYADQTDQLAKLREQVTGYWTGIFSEICK